MCGGSRQARDGSGPPGLKVGFDNLPVSLPPGSMVEGVHKGRVVTQTGSILCLNS